MSRYKRFFYGVFYWVLLTILIVVLSVVKNVYGTNEIVSLALFGLPIVLAIILGIIFILKPHVSLGVLFVLLVMCILTASPLYYFPFLHWPVVLIFNIFAVSFLYQYFTARTVPTFKMEFISLVIVILIVLIGSLSTVFSSRLAFAGITNPVDAMKTHISIKRSEDGIVATSSDPKIFSEDYITVDSEMRVFLNQYGPFNIPD